MRNYRSDIQQRIKIINAIIEQTGIEVYVKPRLETIRLINVKNCTEIIVNSEYI